MPLDFERARFNMVEQQVRPWEVLDQRVLDVLRELRREEYVPARWRRQAFADVSLPLEHGEVMMKPVVEGRMLQALAVKPEDAILEVGTGSGFITACLARLGREVRSVEIHAAMAERARARLAAAGFSNASVDAADALAGFEPGRTYDCVCVTGAVAVEPERFRRWLAPGGRLFLIRGLSPAMEATLTTLGPDSQYVTDSLFETDLPYLVGAAPLPRFVL
ncbi:MAG TPA: protein-L-isoaspartate O-methyltransferase [Pseudomonadota bacterium]|nr:protein-L-isoaspartate O-methyltransferase [Pseudomonadota bacterium]HRA38483.1 protein-L-isoaspartate O-methyltransferase [Pseudomonadota bacterium]